MATSPQFAATVNVGSGLVPATADSSLTAPTNTTTIFTAGSSGSRVDYIRAFGVGTTVAGRLNIFRYDGSSYWLIDQALVNATTPSATQAVWSIVLSYPELVLKSGDSIRVAVMESGNESLICCSAFGGDL